MRIIAEVGSNVKSLNDCLDSVKIAANCGADAVKFQFFTDEEMFGMYLGNRPVIDESWLVPAKETADKYGIEFMCTFFSPERLLRHAELINTIKIASSDLGYEELLATAKGLNKPVIISSGGHSLADVDRSVHALKGADVTVLYCESSYPAYATDFRKISDLAKICKNIGLSDHSKEVFSIPLMAKGMGLKVIEKHVNFMGYGDTPDAPHSLSTDDFKRMVRAIKGEDEVTLRSLEEADMVVMHNRRLIVSKPINRGDAFLYGENFGAFRSIKKDVNGLSPYLHYKINGKRSARDLMPGDSIGPGEVYL